MPEKHLCVLPTGAAAIPRKTPKYLSFHYLSIGLLVLSRAYLPILSLPPIHALFHGCSNLLPLLFLTLHLRLTLFVSRVLSHSIFFLRTSLLRLRLLFVFSSH